ncbi:hypothetical protein [Sphingomonas fuzhouensis]|uniref:hypothetical protein n=1 Tax=Sphingomonas fuzhouensis TaxID=3106033 RepID=UPI002AFF3AA5|nr:hypothetical protein [Sphingomonas sp. SGZ-02]
MLLARAEQDVRRWCCPREARVDRRRHPDTHWLWLFSGQVEANDARLFLSTFLLTKFVAWDRAGVAAAIMAIQAAAAFDPCVDIPRWADRLPILRGQRRQFSSAASKIATFARPRDEIYIWDRLASKAARHRDWVRNGRVGAQYLGRPYEADGRHDYPAFWRACDQARREEREKVDFQQARDRLIADFRHGAGGEVMADAARVPDSFIERRLLDKLMFWEGTLLENRPL